MTWIPPGRLGDAEVVAMMRRLAQDGARDARTVTFVRRLIARSCASGDVGCAAGTLDRWLRGVWYYQPDPRVDGLVDTVQAVPAMLAQAESEGRVIGDCDEAAVLAAALGAAAGFTSRLVVVTFYPHLDYHHVYAEILLPGAPGSPPHWAKLDPTMPEGWRQPVRALTVPV